MMKQLQFLCFPPLLLAASGCALLGVAAAKMPQVVAPRYSGLKDQTCAVMVWADRGTRMDFPNLQADLATGIQGKLVSKNKDNVRHPSGAWPVDARSILRYQQDYPQVEHMPIDKVAPVFGVSRLIYVEIEGFGTRAEDSVQLLRGSAVASVKVLEIANGKAKVTYQESEVRAVFPRKSPREGLPGVDEYRIYMGTVDALTTELANRFRHHEEDRG